MKAMHCPRCYSSEVVSAQEGEHLCPSCRQDLAVVRGGVRVSPAVLAAITQRFWGMTSSRQAGEELSLNDKTVKRYYDLLRRRIWSWSAEQNGDAVLTVQGTHGKVLPLFGFTLQEGGVRIWFPPQEGEGQAAGHTADYLVCADSAAAQRLLDLDRCHCYVVDNGLLRHVTMAANPGRDFWLYVKQGLAAYRGGYRHNFPLFIREMEYRFNRRHHEGGDEELTRLLLSGYEPENHS